MQRLAPTHRPSMYGYGPAPAALAGTGESIATGPSYLSGAGPLVSGKEAASNALPPSQVAGNSPRSQPARLAHLNDLDTRQPPAAQTAIGHGRERSTSYSAQTRHSRGV